MITLEQHEKLIELADGHQRADEYQSGHYIWIDGPYGTGACGIGCTIRDAREIGIVGQETPLSSHFAFGEMYGPGGEYIGQMLDRIFEGLPQSERPAFTPRLLRAMVPGRNYSHVKAQISSWSMQNTTLWWPDWAIFADKLIATIEAVGANGGRP